nr:hypothetical protein CFP56_59604 [Quercus suber]
MASRRGSNAGEGQVREEKQPRSNWLNTVMPPSISQKIPEQTVSQHDAAQDYLVGVRGVLAIMSFLWVFLQTFAPATVAHSANDIGPGYQIALRKSLSVLFWNDTMIYSSFIFLSARTICLPFLLDSTKLTLASSVFRRGIRLWFPTAATLIVVYIVFTKALSSNYLADFASRSGNASMQSNIYHRLPNSLANFNAIFEIFWISHFFSYQGGSLAFPTQTLWMVSVIFQQSYTVYMTMVIVPYTRKSWRLWGAAVFIITAWWVYSWAWYSISGLLIADAVINMDLKAKCQAHRIPVMIAAAFMMIAGYFMCFFWVDVRPDLQNEEIDYHTGLYNTGGLYDNDVNAPQLRADNYLVICGFYLFLESTDFLQKIFRNPALVFIGKRSFSKSDTRSIAGWSSLLISPSPGYFLLQSIIVYTVGIRLATSILPDDGSLRNYASASGAAFIVSLLVTIAAGELFYWIFDVTSQKAGRLFFTWIRE